MVYMYTVKHNYILGSLITNTKAHLHVSVINIGRLQVVHEKLTSKLTKVCGEFPRCGVGARYCLCHGP